MDSNTTQIVEWGDEDGSMRVSVGCLGVDVRVRAKRTTAGGKLVSTRLTLDEIPLDQAEDFAAKLLGAVRQERATQAREAKAQDKGEG